MKIRGRGASRWARSSRRGVSEVIGTLLMVAIVASLGATIFIFASGSLNSLSSGFTNLMSRQGNMVSESYVVEQVAFSGSEATLYVRNVGSTTTDIVAVYVTNQTTGASVGQYQLSPAVTVLVGGSYAIGPLTFTPVHGQTYSFKVDSSRGNSVIYYAKNN